MNLSERYRPKVWSDVVGQGRAMQQIEILRRGSGLPGRAYFITGPSGSGKTTLAKLISEEVTGPHGTMEMDAQRLNVELLREIDRMCFYRPIGAKGGHCFIFNEIHNASAKIISELQTILEARHVQANGTFVFTTTNRGQQHMFDTKHDAIPFLSRCIKLELNTVKDTKLAFAVRAQQVAKAENLDGQPLSFYQSLVAKHEGNMRSILQAIEGGEALLKTQEQSDEELAARLNA